MSSLGGSGEMEEKGDTNRLEIFGGKSGRDGGSDAALRVHMRVFAGAFA